jgi:hypothetical protein
MFSIMFILKFTHRCIRMKTQLTLLSPAKPSLGLYLRPGWNDHTVFLRLLAEDKAVSGLVLDARYQRRHEQLREVLMASGVHAVLDTDFMQMATPGGSVLGGLDGLPWRRFAGATPTQLIGQIGRELAASIADVVLSQGFSAVLAPTHLLRNATDKFFGANRAVAAFLRAELDRRDMADTPIFYPLALPAGLLGDPTQRAIVLEGLRALDVDALWLRLHPFGTSSAGPLALRHYIEIGWELGRLDLPIVAERTGTVGLALMAFGAAGGIESGITLGERFDARAWSRPPDPNKTPYSHPPQVYLHEIAALVSPDVARKLAANRQMAAALGCRDPLCCRRGMDGMLADPRRHFVLRRTAEVERIGTVAPEARTTVYTHDILQPAALLSVRAARVAPELDRVQHRLEGWHRALEFLESRGQCPAPIPALGHRVSAARPKPYSVN